MAATISSPNQSALPHQKSEFTVADGYEYNRSGPVRWIISHLLRYPLYIALFVVCAVTTNFMFALIPVLTGRAFDLVLQPTPDPRQLLLLAVGVLGLVLLRGVIDLTNSTSIQILAQRLERDARQELYTSLLGKSQTFHNKQRVGDIMARAANDVSQLNPMMNPGVALITESFVGLFTPIIFISTMRIELLFWPLFFIVIFYFALRRYMRQLNPVAGQMRMQFGMMNAGLNETIAGIEVVKSTAQEEKESNRFLGNASRYRDFFVQEGQIQARYLPLLLLGFVLAGAFAHALWLLWNGEMSVGEVVAFMGVLGVLRFPAFISIFTFSLVQLGLAGSRRILELMEEESELDENMDGHSGRIVGEIVFNNVTFSHELSDPTQKEPKPILENVSFRAEPGETVAIVGQTGSGKSTLTKLVNRIYDVDSGSILIDTVEVSSWNLESLRSQISTIEQDIFLFSRTVAENIAFGLGEDATQEQIEEAAKAAQAHEFIMGFADGYETVIGERGVTLSGGQRQRLAIARALLTDPRILIIDDSTSAIDSATEDRIQRAINKVLEGRTTLLITHRLSQIRRADKILMLHQGQIIAQGSHEQLLADNELYQRIFARYE